MFISLVALLFRWLFVHLSSAPFGRLPAVRPNSSFLYYLKYGTLQYTICMPTVSLLALVMNVFGSEKEKKERAIWSETVCERASALTNASLLRVRLSVSVCVSVRLPRYYGDGIIAANRGYVYVTAVTNLSQLLALYTLVWLYSILHNELMPFKPLPKFLVVKAVVFFTLSDHAYTRALSHKP